MAAVSYPYLEEARPTYLAEQFAIISLGRRLSASSSQRRAANEAIARLTEEEAMLAAQVSTELRAETQEALAKALLADEVSATQLIEAGYRPVGYPEGAMASTDTLQTMRAAGGFTIPESLKGMLPLLLIFGIVLLIIFKK